MTKFPMPMLNGLKIDSLVTSFLSILLFVTLAGKGEASTSHVLTVHTSGQGCVHIQPPGRLLGDNDSEVIDSAQQDLLIVPEPESGWVFSSWGGSLTGNSVPAVVDIENDVTIEVVFVEGNALALDILGQGALLVHTSGNGPETNTATVIDENFNDASLQAGQ